jgi:hypothetical protein
MRFADTVSVNAPREQVWATLVDPYAIGACVPGLQALEVDEDGKSFGGEARLQVGGASLVFPARVSWVEQDAPCGGTLRASAVLGGFAIEGNGVVALAANGEGMTTVEWEVVVQFPEKLAGNAIMMKMARPFAARFIEAFFHCVQGRLESV